MTRDTTKTEESHQNMRDIRIAAAQFEHRDGDKAYNLGRIRELTRTRRGPGRRDRLLPRVQRDGLHLPPDALPRRARRPGRAGPGRPVGRRP